MEPAISELSDEMDTLQTHIEGLRHLSETLSTFNESFASYLYVMEMNGLTTDWPQVWVARVFCRPFETKSCLSDANGCEF